MNERSGAVGLQVAPRGSGGPGLIGHCSSVKSLWRGEPLREFEQGIDSVLENTVATEWGKDSGGHGHG